MNALLEKVDSRVREGVKTEMKSASEGYLTTAKFEERMNEMGVEKDAIKQLTEAVEKQGDAIREMREKETKKVKTIPEILKENHDKIKSLQDEKGRKVSFFVPKTNVTTASITSDPVSYVIPGFSDTGIAPNTLEDAWRRLGVVQDIPGDSHGVISYTDLTTRTNNAAATAEGSVYPENAYAWTGYTATIEKVISSIPMTWEALTDIPSMEATIRRLITADLQNKVEDQLWDGDGSAPNVNGLYTKAQSASTSGTTITNADPNIFDLAMWMKNYVIENYGSKYIPNVLVMNNGDALKAKWVKDSNGQYVANPFSSPDMTTIDGMTVIASPQVTAGTMLVGDMRYATLYISPSVEIEVGLDGNDFTYDLYTLKARRRLCTVIRTTDAYAFLKSTDIDGDLSNLTTVTA